VSTSERAEQILQELPIGVVVVDRDYDIQRINSVARRLLEIHTPALGEDIIHLARRALGEPLRDALEGALQGQDVHIVHELTSTPANPGQTRYCELTSLLVHGMPDRPDSGDLIVLIIADVTEREVMARQQRAALEEAERLRRAELERMQLEQHLAADAAEERSGRLQQLLTESTRSVRQLLQANEDLATANAALRTTNEELLVGNEEAQAAMEEIETLNEEQQATNEELETLNEELQATVEELNATNEDLESRTGELQEQAAAREHLMAALDEERARLNAVLANLSEAVMLVDTNGCAVLTNAAFQSMFGERLPAIEDASGRPLPAQANPATMAARGEVFTQSFTVAGSDGARRWYAANGQPIRIGNAQAGLVVIRDVSEQSLRRLQEEFVALASHELRTPVSAIRGSLQLLQRTFGSQADPRVARYLEVGLSQTRLLEDLVMDLTDVVRIQSGQVPIERAQVNLVEIAQTTVELARPLRDNQEIRLDVPREPIAVNGDPRRLQQVLLNLISNAIDHGASAKGIDVRLRREDSIAVLEVTDYGPGIPEEARTRLFERFYKQDTSRSGLGLGLYLARAIVLAHEGTLEVQSTDGQGTTFIMRLPFLRQGA
jgi:two-component system CheB/CheR fusion protein